MKKIIICILLVALMLTTLSSCSEPEVTDLKDREAVDTWLNDIIYKSTEEFYEKNITLVEAEQKKSDNDSQAQKENNSEASDGKVSDTTGCVEIFKTAMEQFTGKASTSATFGQIMENGTADSSGYTFTTEEYGTSEKFVLLTDGKSKNISLEHDSEENYYLIEIRETSEDSYALHYYERREELWNEARLTFSGDDGNLSYSYDHKVRPTRIYGLEAVESDWALDGDDTFEFFDGNLVYTSNRTYLTDNSSIKKWITEEFQNGVKEFQENNIYNARKLKKSKEFKKYIEMFTDTSFAESVLLVINNGKYKSGAYVWEYDGNKNVLSFDKASKNISLRYNGDDGYFVFELKECGKDKFISQYYKEGKKGTWDIYRLVCRNENGSISYEKSKEKPALIYSKDDSKTDYGWAQTGEYYFAAADGKMTYTDVESEASAAYESQIKYEASIDAMNAADEESKKK